MSVTKVTNACSGCTSFHARQVLIEMGNHGDQKVRHRDTGTCRQQFNQRGGWAMEYADCGWENAQQLRRDEVSPLRSRVVYAPAYESRFSFAARRLIGSSWNCTNSTGQPRFCWEITVAGRLPRFGGHRPRHGTKPVFYSSRCIVPQKCEVLQTSAGDAPCHVRKRLSLFV